MIINNRFNVNKVLEYCVIATIIIIGCAGVYSGRGLYADGPIWLYEMLLRKGFYIFDPHREYVQYLVELPFAAAIQLGVRELNFLIKIHSFGFVATPIALWLVSLYIQRNRRVFWTLALAIAVTYLRSGFFAAGEYNTVNALVALSFSILMLDRISYKCLGLLVFCSLVLIKSYESMAFLGLLLCVIVATRLVNNKDDGNKIRLGLCLVGILNLIGLYYAIKSILFERSYDFKATTNISSIFEFNILYLEITAIILFLLIFNLHAKGARLLKLAAFVLSLLYVVYVNKWDRSGVSYGYYSYAYRSVGAYLLFGIFFVEYLLSLLPKLKYNAEMNAGAFAAISSCAFFTMAMFMLAHTYNYYQWLKRFEAEAISVRGFVHIDKTEINRSAGWLAGVNWPWSNAMLSIILRGNAEGIILNASDFNGWEHIDPLKVEKYPLKDYYKSGLY